MADKISCGLDELLSLFEDKLSLAEILSAKYLGKVSAAITRRRIELELNQTEFAHYVGVSQGMVSKWEGGDYNFTIKSLAHIAEKLEMELFVSLSNAREGSVISSENEYIYSNSEKGEFISSCKIIDFRAKQLTTYNSEDIKTITSYNEKLEM